MTHEDDKTENRQGVMSAGQMSASPPAGSAQTNTDVTFDYLTPGDGLELSIIYSWGPNGVNKINWGQSVQKVQADGRITFRVVTDFLTGGHQGTAKAWVRPQGSDFDAPPVTNALGHPALFKFHLP